MSAVELKQAKRRYRALWRQLVSELERWKQSELDSRAALSSLSNVLDRAASLMQTSSSSSPSSGDYDANPKLGALGAIPGLGEALLRKHVEETERVHRMLRLLFVQLKDDLERMEQLLEEAWALHRGPAGRALLALYQHQRQAEEGGGGSEDDENDTTPAPHEYLRWMGDIVGMVSRDTWRKQLMMSTITHGDDAEAREARAYAVSQWPGQAADGFLDAPYLQHLLTATNSSSDNSSSSRGHGSNG